MPIPALILPLLAAAAGSAASPEATVVVTGHAWAPFISPMGEPFRAHSVSDDTLADWFRQADRNSDGLLTLDEMQADADRFFARLDADHDGEIDPDELVHYEWEVAPDIQVMSRTRRPPGAPVATHDRDRDGERDGDAAAAHRAGRHESDANDDRLGLAGELEGAARYALLDIPEPVAAADTNFDRGISLAEFRAAAIARFQLLDNAHTGGLTLTQLETLRSATLADSHRHSHKSNETDARIGNPLPPGR